MNNMDISKVEYLKAFVQNTLDAFHHGAGIANGQPEPMTWELAVTSIWNEIDKVFSSNFFTKSNLIRFRLSKEGASFEELDNILFICGKWTIRSSKRNNKIVAHVVGALNRKTKLGAFLQFLNDQKWEITDFSVGF